MTDLPRTVDALERVVADRAQIAHAADQLWQVTLRVFGATESKDANLGALGEAVEDAWWDAAEAVLLWRTARAELRRAVEQAAKAVTK